MVYAPPDSFEDALSDAEAVPNTTPYRELEVPRVGTFRARKPMANAAGVLGNAVNSKISDEARNDYIGMFVVNHLAPESWDDLIEGMTTGVYPVNSVGEVCRAITTWGTARPTRRSSTLRS